MPVPMILGNTDVSSDGGLICSVHLGINDASGYGSQEEILWLCESRQCSWAALGMATARPGVTAKDVTACCGRRESELEFFGCDHGLKAT